MSRFSRPVRNAVAGLLAISALTIFGVSPASAAATASMVDNGDGSVTVTYSGAAPGDSIVFMGLPSGTTCSSQIPPASGLFFVTTDVSSPLSARMAASPATFTSGTAVFNGGGGGNPPGATTIAAGVYNVCLLRIYSQQPNTVIQQMQVTLGTVTPTTSATTSTTAPAADPVAPAFTG
ncbi:MAG: hypothetical protein F2947_01060 [Actinobacteria bacterium]|uniref:Unannotated protein n=2 Tax=freshwater metagenome TaxID=449393 RepID=A0A6J6P5J1_9ZZZZ|nr:hypothetical protein [Actinomycetota bacterium]MSX96280.1 hypothetical protein [Actinomycetota bacterium]MSY24357.1 hypothetical protein [Actinomycetota bacterium]MSY33619.1 hypothetical protein [Actinomycetota bacterium]MTA41976.1 hypothetical protein [Actinomycetota bacterium]